MSQYKMEDFTWNDSYLDTFASRDSLDISRGQLKELKIGCDHNHETGFGAVADSGYRDSSSLQSLNNCGSSQIFSCKPSENDNNVAIGPKQYTLARGDHLNHEDLENKNPLIQLNDAKSDITRSPMTTPKVVFPAKIKITTPSNMTVTSSSSHQYHRIVNDDKDMMSGLNSNQKNSPYKSSAKSERILADLKSPNIRRVVVNRTTSTPRFQYHTGSGKEEIFATEIGEDLSPLLFSSDESMENAHSDSPKKLFKRLSQQFTASPQRFTQRLKTVIEETLSHSDFEKAENNDVSMRRLTQEFIKICNEHHSRIEDESMPAYTSICWNDTQEQLKRPLKLLPMLDEKVGSPLNDTASFIYWENKCNSEDSPIQRKQDAIDSYHRRVIFQDQSSSAGMKTETARENLLKFIQSLIRSSENVPASPTESRDDFLKTLKICAESLTGDQNSLLCNSPLDCILECTEDTGSANSGVNTRVTSDFSTPNKSALSNSKNTYLQNTSPIVQSGEGLDSLAMSLVGSRNQHSKSNNKGSTKSPARKSPPANTPNRTPKYLFVPKIVKPETLPRADKKTNSPFLRNGNNGLREQALTPKESEAQKSKFKFFPTPGRTPPMNKSKPKKKYFENPSLSPAPKTAGRTKTNIHRLSPYRLIYNAVTSPVATYIRGMDTKLIQNVNARTNDRMLTPTTKRPVTKSNAISTPFPSPGYKDSAGLKFKLSPTTISKQSRKEDILNTAMCESDTSSCAQSTCASILPKVYYQPSTYLKMIKSDKTKSPGKALFRCEDKIIYRHEGRVKSSIPTKSPRAQPELSSEDNISVDSADVSVVHQRPAVKTNYLCQ